MLRLLEDVGLPEMVIQLASLAITEATSDISSQVTVDSPNKHRVKFSTATRSSQQYVEKRFFNFLCTEYVYNSKQ